MTTMFQNMNTETQALSEKLAALDVEKFAIAALADGSVCKQLAGTTTFNAQLNPTPAAPVTVLSPPILYSSYSAGPPAAWGPAVATVGAVASTASRNLVVSAIRLVVTEKTGTAFKGHWVIEFDNTRLVRPIRPLNISTSLTASATTPTATVATCQGNSGGAGGAGAGGSGEWCGAFIGSFGQMTGVISQCKGKAVASGCGSAATVCAVYDMTTACPSGYSLRTVMDTSAGGSVSGATSGQQSGGFSGGTLYTCMPN